MAWAPYNQRRAQSCWPCAPSERSRPSVGFHFTCFDREGIERWRWLSLDTCSFAALTSAPGRKDWGTFLASIMRWKSREQYSSGLANCGTIHPRPKRHDAFCGVTAALPGAGHALLPVATSEPLRFLSVPSLYCRPSNLFLLHPLNLAGQ